MKSSKSKSLAKVTHGKLSRESAKIEKTKKEVLERGAKHLRPLTLARKRVVRLTASILVAVVATFLVVIGLLIYIGKNDSAVVYRVARIVPYPLAKVNGSFVSYADYLFEIRYRKNIYANPTGPASASQQPIDFGSNEGQKLLKDLQTASAERAKAKSIIKQLSSRHNITISDQELKDGLQTLIESQGGEEKFEDAIRQFYGWDMGDFTQEYRLQLLQEKLQLKLLPQNNRAAHQRAERILAQLRKEDDFAKLAKQYSQDTASKSKGGDLGFVNQDTPYVEEFKRAALGLKKGQTSDVVVTSFGFHVIKATAQKGDAVRVSHILIRFNKDIETILQSELDSSKVTNFVNFPKPAKSTNPA